MEISQQQYRNNLYMWSDTIAHQPYCSPVLVDDDDNEYYNRIVVQNQQQQQQQQHLSVTAVVVEESNSSLEDENNESNNINNNNNNTEHDEDNTTTDFDDDVNNHYYYCHREQRIKPHTHTTGGTENNTISSSLISIPSQKSFSSPSAITSSPSAKSCAESTISTLSRNSADIEEEELFRRIALKEREYHRLQELKRLKQQQRQEQQKRVTTTTNNIDDYHHINNNSHNNVRFYPTKKDIESIGVPSCHDVFGDDLTELYRQRYNNSDHYHRKQPSFDNNNKTMISNNNNKKNNEKKNENNGFRIVPDLADDPARQRFMRSDLHYNHNQVNNAMLSEQPMYEHQHQQQANMDEYIHPKMDIYGRQAPLSSENVYYHPEEQRDEYYYRHQQQQQNNNNGRHNGMTVVPQLPSSSSFHHHHHHQYNNNNDHQQPYHPSSLMSTGPPLPPPQHRPQYSTNTANKSSCYEKIEIEVSPGVFLPLHGSLETQIALENNTLISCTCLSCDTKMYTTDKAIAVVCYNCCEISPVTENKYNNNNNSGSISIGGVGLGISEQTYFSSRA